MYPPPHTGHRNAQTLSSSTSSRMASNYPASSQRFQRRPQSPSNLRLPSLPKFHPATYNSGSAESSLSTTPSSNLSSPGTSNPFPSMPSYAPPQPSPMSPRRQYSEAQRQLLMYQRELIGNRASPGTRSPRPASPHLQPLGSPGPVTPLELEDGGGGGYLMAGTGNDISDSTKEQMLESIIEKETGTRSKRRREDGSYVHSRNKSNGVANITFDSF